MSGVIVIDRQPIRSALPRARPKVTGRPVRGSGKAANLISEEPGVGVRAKRQPDLLLEGGFGVGHMIMSAALHCGRA
jgi:hypothetical protein